MDWYNAENWTSNFVYGGYDSWRLPTTDDGIFQFGYDGVTNNAGYNMTNSEMRGRFGSLISTVDSNS